MEEAMKAVQKADIGINQAAREYGVPRTTLKEWCTVVSKYLVRPSDTPSMKRSLPRTRLLTNASVLPALEEKERNKRQAIEEKEKRKIEREQKKKQREEQLKLKAEEKARKTAEKVAEKAKKVSEHERAKRDKQSKASAPKSASAKRKLSSPSPEETSEVPQKKTRVSQYISEIIDTNVCCMCFRKYDEDVLEGTGAD